jgi:hypothetical protein
MIPSRAEIEMAERLNAYERDPWHWIREVVWTVSPILAPVTHGTVTGRADRPGRGAGDTEQQAAARARWGDLSPRKLLFLTVFAACGNISHACRQIGANRATHYDWLAADPDYAVAFAEADEEATETLEAEAWRRAEHGVTKPIVSKGAVVCYVQQYSDMLMLALAGSWPRPPSDITRASSST